MKGFIIGILAVLIIAAVCLYIDYGYKLSYVGHSTFVANGVTFDLDLNLDGTGELSSKQYNYHNPLSWNKAAYGYIFFSTTNPIQFCINTCTRGQTFFAVMDHKVYTNCDAARANAEDPKYYSPLE